MRLSLSIRTALIAAFAAGATGSLHAGEVWTENGAEALARAQREKKDLFVAFTGSDWTIYDAKLAGEVFDQAQFISEAPRAFVLLRLDFPKKKQLSPELKRQNDEWKAKFRVNGFPTVMLLDSAGKVYARTGYRPKGAEAYLKHLAELRAIREQRDAALAKAGTAAGIEKARLLDSAIAPMERVIVIDYYSDVVAEIVRLDADGRAGLKSKYDAWIALRKADISAAVDKSAEAVASLDEAIRLLGPTGETTQEALYFKGFILMGQKDKPGAKAALEAAIQAAPKTRRALECRWMIEKQLK